MRLSRRCKMRAPRRFPAKKLESNGARALVWYKDTGNTLPGHRGILIVEDNPGDVRLMREALRNIEPAVTIHVAGDGEEALRFLRREGQHADAPKPALIFLDFNLPKADSRDRLRQMKS